MSDFKNNINILIVTNITWVLKFDYNLLNTIFLAKKVVKVFLRKIGQLLEIVIDEKKFDLVNIIIKI